MRKVVLFLFFVNVLWLGAASAHSRPSIAVVHSYHKSYGWVHEVNRGIKAYLKGKKVFDKNPDPAVANYKFKYFHLNAKHYQGNSKKLAEIGQSVILKLRKLSPAAVVLCDDEAVEFIGKPLKSSDFKFVFLGVNKNPRVYGVVQNFSTPEFNHTGLISEHPFEYSIKMALKVAPNVDRIFAFFDKSPSGDGIRANLERHISKLNRTEISVVYIQTNDWNHWKKTIQENQKETNLFLFGTFHTIRDTRGRKLSDQQVIDWITTNSGVPELSILTTHIHKGLLLSISNPGMIHGYEAMELLADIINQKPIRSIPVRTPNHKAIHVNLERAKQLDLEIPLEIISMSRYFERLGV